MEGVGWGCFWLKTTWSVLVGEQQLLPLSLVAQEVITFMSKRLWVIPDLAFRTELRRKLERQAKIEQLIKNRCIFVTLSAHGQPVHVKNNNARLVSGKKTTEFYQSLIFLGAWSWPGHWPQRARRGFASRQTPSCVLFLRRVGESLPRGMTHGEGDLAGGRGLGSRGFGQWVGGLGQCRVGTWSVRGCSLFLEGKWGGTKGMVLHKTVTFIFVHLTEKTEQSHTCSHNEREWTLSLFFSTTCGGHHQTARWDQEAPCHQCQCEYGSAFPAVCMCSSIASSSNASVWWGSWRKKCNQRALQFFQWVKFIFILRSGPGQRTPGPWPPSSTGVSPGPPTPMSQMVRILCFPHSFSISVGGLCKGGKCVWFVVCGHHGRKC